MGFVQKIINFLKPSKIEQSDAQLKDNLLPTGRTFEEQVKIDLQNAIENKKKSTNPKFHRTSTDENLSFNFSDKHSEKLNLLENEMHHNTELIFSIYQIDLRIEQCQLAIEAYEKLKKFCTSKGKGGKIYFEDTWEHLHNSKNPDFRFIEKVELEYLYLTENYEEAEQKLKNEAIKKQNKELVNQFKLNADSDLIDIIRNNPGIMQSEIYNYFNDIYKTSIRNVLKKLESTGKIKKIKTGNSFKIYLNTSEMK
ncbi:hypothetical protein [Lysinibacillus sp. LZ02]|uniref:hypothetical protein n=1 Tax=Lysinibacillus sp. LZ02 TaxID=3420668 RepID=UPI003D36449E